MNSKASKLTALALSVFVAGPMAAETVGQSEYMSSCAACHGADGKGAGPMVGYLMGSVPDLTQLSSANGGVFPVTKVYSTIDGTMEVGSHGSREMPIWGNRYQLRGAAGANPDFAASQAETFATFRILALTEYLASLQE